MPAAPDLKELGRYRIDRVVGKGAMGVVYEGFDPRLSRRVAIKTILKSHLDAELAKDYSQRFVREAQAVARLNHPNIVQVHDFGEEGDVAYLVLEYIEGKELKTFFDAREHFDLKETARLMGELCDALEFAHNAGIIHRDVKPGNVMIDTQGRAKLMDFGVARIQDSSPSHATSTMVGTPAFMSPEQISGAGIDRRTDVFSAGVILYQFLTGNMPFDGSGTWTIAKQIMQDDPPRPSSVDTAVTPLFDAVVNKALAKKPEDRFQSAREFALALRLALEGKPLEDESAKTIIAPLAGTPRPTRPPQAMPPASAATQVSGALATQGTQELELEYWRSIKDGNDANDFELYVRQFPNGVYTTLAKSKIAKLRGIDTDTQLASKGAPPAKPGGRSAATLAAAGGVIAAVAAGLYFAFSVPTPPPAGNKGPDNEAQAKAIAAEQKAAADKQAADKAAAEEKAAREKSRAAEVAAAEKAAREKTRAAADKAAAEKAAIDKAAADKTAAARAAADKEQQDAERRRQQAAIEEERKQMKAKLDDERKQNQARLDEDRRRLQQEQQQAQQARELADKAAKDKQAPPPAPATAPRRPAYVAPAF